MERRIIAACILLLSLTANNAVALSEELADQDYSKFFSSFRSESPEQVEQNLDAFGRHLKLTDQQLDSWYRFKITFIEQAESRQQRFSAIKELKSNRKDLSSLEKLKLKEQFLQVHLKELRQMIEVVDRLYARLDKHQKVQFDRAMQYFWSGHHATSSSRRLSSNP